MRKLKNFRRGREPTPPRALEKTNQDPSQVVANGLVDLMSRSYSKKQQVTMETKPETPRFLVNVGSLRTRLGFIAKAIGNASIQPILSALRIEFNGSRLLIASYDLDACVQMEMETLDLHIPENGLSNYVICPSARLVNELLSKLPGEEDIQFALTDEVEHQITISCGGFVCTIRGFDPETYPELPTVVSSEAVLKRTLPLGDIRTGLEKVIYAVSSEETKQILTGVFCEVFNHGMRFTATDGHRIARVSEVGIGDEKKLGELIYSTVFSKAVLNLLVAMPGADDVQLLIKLDERRAEFIAAKTTASANLIIGQFPNVELILNPAKEALSASIRIERVQLMSAVERCQIVATATENKVVVFDVKTSKIVVSAKNDNAKVHEKLSSRLTMGKEQKIAFNCKYLLAALKAARSELIDLQVTKVTGKIYSVDDPAHEQLVAQIQIRGDEKDPEPEEEPELEEEETPENSTVMDVLELEHRPTSPAIDAYIKFKKKYPDRVVLMRFKDFYEAFGLDATALAAAVPELVLTEKLVAGFRLLMSGMPYSAVERFIPMINKNSRGVAVIDGNTVLLVPNPNAEAETEAETESDEPATPEPEEQKDWSFNEDQEKQYQILTVVPPSDINFKGVLKEAGVPVLDAAIDYCKAVPDGNKTRHKQLEAQLKKLTK